jgi:O-antigen ligase
MESNKEWRLNWWHDIVDYTVYGKYFWHGKGFGVNLADDDGYQVHKDNQLRSPHNVHMTILARMGVPGAVAWILMHATWLYCVWRAYMLAKRRKDEAWTGVFLFLFAYYVAFMINGSFDVFIEGPMGGIWFWTIFGAGVGALWCYRYRRDLFLEKVEEDEHQSRFAVANDESARRPQLLPAAGWGRPGLPIGAGASRTARP